jgi:putative GTP pyrophosphokinase
MTDASLNLPTSRNQLDRAGSRIRKAAHEGIEPDPAVLEVIDTFRGWHLDSVQRVQRDTTEFFHRIAGVEEEHLPITSRLKTPPAIRAKLVRTNTSLFRMQDIAGARIVVPNLEWQDWAREHTEEKLYRGCVGASKDQREEPDQYGYRAVHIIVRLDERFVEIQIRTRWQDRWAQLVESLDSGMGTDLKHGRGPAEWLEWLHAVSDEYRKADLGLPFQLPPTPVDVALAAQEAREEEQ